MTEQRWTKTALLLTIVTTIALSQDCPSPCVCIQTTTYCNRTGITAIPKNLPNNTVTLYIGYNPIKFIPKTAFYGLTKLQELDTHGDGQSWDNAIVVTIVKSKAVFVHLCSVISKIGVSVLKLIKARHHYFKCIKAKLNFINYLLML
jgi:hypothetical protein